MKLFFVLAVATSAMLLVQGAPSITSEEMGKAVEQLKEMITSEIQSAYGPRAHQEAEAKSAYGPRARQEAEAKSAYGPRAHQGVEAKSAYLPYYRAQSAWGPREQNYHAQSAWGPREQNYHAQSAWGPRKQGYGRQDKVTAQVRGAQIQNCGTAGNIVQAALTPLNTLFPSQFGVLVNCQISPGCVQVRVDVPADDRLVDIDVCDLGNGQACVQVYVEPSQPCIGIIPITVPIPLANGQQINIEIRIDPQIPFVSPTGCATVNVQAPACP